jgi:hypothetical protein
MAGKTLTTFLVAGMLAAAANPSFADTRQERHPRNDATQRQTARDDGPITAISKDGKALQVTVDVPVLNKGNYSDDQFKRSLKGGLQMAALTTFKDYTEAEIPGKIGEIQKKITDAVGAMVPMGTVTAGKPDYAKPGVNYGNVTVTKVAEVTGKTILEQKAAAPKTSGVKAPGA